MRKVLAATVSGLAFLGLAACNDGGGGGDNTTTQSVEPSTQEQTAPMEDPAAAPEGGAGTQGGDGMSQ